MGKYGTKLLTPQFDLLCYHASNQWFIKCSQYIPIIKHSPVPKWHFQTQNGHFQINGASHHLSSLPNPAKSTISQGVFALFALLPQKPVEHKSLSISEILKVIPLKLMVKNCVKWCVSESYAPPYRARYFDRTGRKGK